MSLLSAGLGSTNKSAISLLSDSRFVLSVFLFTLNSLAGVAGYNGSPKTRFSRGTTRLMSWPDGERYSCPLHSHIVSLLLSLVSTLVFCRTRGVLSHLNSLTHRFPRFPLRNFGSLCPLSSPLQWTQSSIKLLSLALAESRILPAAPADTRPRTPLMSFYAVQLRILYAAHSLATLCLSTTSGPRPGAPWSSAMPPSLGRGRVTTTTAPRVNLLVRF